MKKIISLICVICVLFCQVCFTATAQQLSYIYLEHVSTTGNEVTVNLCVEDKGDLGIKSFGIYVKYSGKELSLKNGELISENGNGTINIFHIPGFIPDQILWECTGDSVGTEKVVVAKLTFLKAETASESDINISLVIDGTNIPKDAAGNTIEVGIKVSGVSIPGKDSPTPPDDEFLPGDADSSKKVDLADVTLILKYIAKWNITINVENAEVTGDGEINLADVTLLLRKIAKWDVILK